MSAEVSFTKRAAAELSRCFNGISVSRQSSASNGASKPSATGATTATSPGALPSAGAPGGTIAGEDPRAISGNSANLQCNSASVREDNRQSTGSQHHFGGKTSTARAGAPHQGTIQPQHSSPSRGRGGSKTAAVTLANGSCCRLIYVASFLTDSLPFFPGKQHSQLNGHLNESTNNSLEGIVQLTEVHLSNMNAPATPTAQRRPSRHGPPPKAPPKTTRARRKNYLLNLNKPSTFADLLANAAYLKRLFAYVSPLDRCTLSQVSVSPRRVSFRPPLTPHFSLCLLLSLSLCPNSIRCVLTSHG